MEDRMLKIISPADKKVALKVIPGHFVDFSFSYHSLYRYHYIKSPSE